MCKLNSSNSAPGVDQNSKRLVNMDMPEKFRFLSGFMILKKIVDDLFSDPTSRETYILIPSLQWIFADNDV